mmetsp:Transcript_45756/g.82357  ORF Transcript_45756/g.82357 Transcript_45756/m.82357 type:complete len:288 (-) Transcript_45756:488-1351(-)
MPARACSRSASSAFTPRSASSSGRSSMRTSFSCARQLLKTLRRAAEPQIISSSSSSPQAKILAASSDSLRRTASLAVKVCGLSLGLSCSEYSGAKLVEAMTLGGLEPLCDMAVPDSPHSSSTVHEACLRCSDGTSSTAHKACTLPASGQLAAGLCSALAVAEASEDVEELASLLTEAELSSLSWLRQSSSASNSSELESVTSVPFFSQLSSSCARLRDSTGALALKSYALRRDPLRGTSGGFKRSVFRDGILRSNSLTMVLRSTGRLGSASLDSLIVWYADRSLGCS